MIGHSRNDEFDTLLTHKYFDSACATMREVVSSIIKTSQQLMVYCQRNNPAIIGELDKYIEIIKKLNKIIHPDNISAWRIYSTISNIRSVFDEFEDGGKARKAKRENSAPNIRTKAEFGFSVILASHLSFLIEESDNIDHSEYSVPAKLLNKFMSNLLKGRLLIINERIEQYKSRDLLENALDIQTKTSSILIPKTRRSLTSEEHLSSDLGTNPSMRRVKSQFKVV